MTNLTAEFQSRSGRVKAVNNVSFGVDRGRTLGIVGESGSGKSVTSLSIMGLVPEPNGAITAGEIMFDGRDLRKYSKRDMRAIRGREIAMIFQDPMTSLNPVLTLGRQLMEALQLHMNLSKRQAFSRATELLALVGIPSPAKRLSDYPHQFSGGMRQRVMIAMALSCDPKLLIADEPTTALDVTIQAQILELIKRLQKELGTALIIITHDLGVVAGMADEVAVMYAGSIVEQGSTEQIFADPRMPYTIGLLRSIPRVDEEAGHKLVPIRGAPPDMTTLGATCPFFERCDYALEDRCNRETPPLRSSGEGHLAACLFDVSLQTTVPPPWRLADRDATVAAGKIG